MCRSREVTMIPVNGKLRKMSLERHETLIRIKEILKSIEVWPKCITREDNDMVNQLASVEYTEVL